MGGGKGVTLKTCHHASRNTELMADMQGSHHKIWEFLLKCFKKKKHLQIYKDPISHMRLEGMSFGASQNLWGFGFRLILQLATLIQAARKSNQ